MAGTVRERQLNASVGRNVRFGPADETDDDGIRRLLRDNPVPGNISISLEREPCYFADAKLPGQSRTTIVAKENGCVICVGDCTLRRRFVNGSPERVGYLGGLRLDGLHSGRVDVLRRGYDCFHETQKTNPAEFYFSSIATENHRARKLLERGLRGFPEYEFLCDYVTVVLGTRRQRAVGGPQRNSVQSESNESSAARLNDCNRRFQFSPCWAGAELDGLIKLGLSPGDFVMTAGNNKDSRGGALWDQGSFKQTVVQNYSTPILLLRRLLNMVSSWTRMPRLPAPGEVISNGFVSHLTVLPGEDEKLLELVSLLSSNAARRGLQTLTLGFAADDQRLNIVRTKYQRLEYHSRLYVVRWPDFGKSANELDADTVAPEIALL